MRKIFVTLMLLSVTLAKAQTFEGTIKWTFQSEITDPAEKKRMEDMEKKMNDPAAQAKMKEMQAKMEDPQFKKMMESNPQMKAQMEGMMKAMGSGGDMSSLMPKNFVVEIKGGNTHAKMEGGMMGNMEILYLKEKNQSYQLNRADKTYSVLPPSDHKTEATITKTSETKRILGHVCTKSTVVTTMSGHTLQQVFWMTTEIKDLDMKKLAQQGVGASQSMYYEKLEGMPLRIETINAKGRMIMEVAEINRHSVSASVFAIPSDFKEIQAATGVPH